MGNRLKKTSRKAILLGSAGLLTCLGVGTYLFLEHSQSQSVTAVARKVDALSVQQAVDNSKKTSVVLSGQVVANNSSKVKIDPNKGEVKEVFVHKGDTVTVGQPLFSYVTSQELAAQSAQYDAQARANATYAAQNAAGIKWENYNRKLANLNNLKNKYNENPDESLTEQIRSAEDEVAAALIEARAADSEVSTAQIESEKAQATANTETDRLKYDTVTADTAGTITNMNEDLPSQSKSKKEEENFLEITDTSKILVKGSVSEFDREKVNIGQRVEVVDRKNPDKKWMGTIVQVGTLTAENAGDSGNKQQENPNQAKYPYKLELDPGENMPLLGSHTYVNIIEHAPEAGKIILNKSYIMTEKDKSYVWKVEGKKIKRQEVTVQEVSDKLVEITAGVSLQDQISTPREGMTEGMEVGQDVKA